MCRTHFEKMPSQYRICATLDRELYEWVINKATREGRTPSNLAAFFLSRVIKEEMEKEQSLKPLQ